MNNEQLQVSGPLQPVPGPLPLIYDNEIILKGSLDHVIFSKKIAAILGGYAVKYHIFLK